MKKNANEEKIKEKFKIFILLFFFFKTLKEKTIKGNKKKWINLNSPNSRFIFNWSIKLIYAISLLAILPSPIVSGNKIYWYKKLIIGVLVKYKNRVKKQIQEILPKIKAFKFLKSWFFKK